MGGKPSCEGSGRPEAAPLLRGQGRPEAAPSKYNKGFTTRASLDGGAKVGACFMSGLFSRCECDYSTRAPAYLRPLSGPPRPGQSQIDGWQPSKYNKGFPRDGGTTVGACFVSGLFIVANALTLRVRPRIYR